jgi:putative ABC transport system permease protein
MSSLWYFKMAWRDGRSHLKRFFLFAASITIGIAALVSIQSFSDAIQISIDNQSKTLLGADLVLEASFPIDSSYNATFDTLNYQKAEQVRFASMVLAPKTGLSRLVQVRAIEGDFPFYGELILSDQTKRLKDLKGNQAFIDENLADLLSVQVGDSIKVGSLNFEITTLVQKIPGEAAVAAFVGPRVFIPLPRLEETQLIQKGSRITYENFYKVNDAETIAKNLKNKAEDDRVRIQTVEGRKQSLGRALDNLYSFLNLIGFVALLMGAVGVGSSVQVYARQKKTTIAILRCLGVSSTQALAIFIIQISFMGIVGALIGTLIGVSVVPLFPILFSDFLPVTIESGISFFALGKGFGIGLLFTMLFALLPLIQARRTSPLATLRISEIVPSVWNDILHWITVSAIVSTLLAFTFFQTNSWINALIFCIGLSISFSILALTAKGLMMLTRKFFPSNASFTLRQGLANLYRPNNQTLLLLVSIGLGAFLIMTLLLTQQQLLKQLDITAQQSDTNMVLFDVQTDQKETAISILEKNKMPLRASTPIVTMNLVEINGLSVQQIMEDTTRDIRKWALRREYRSSYRNALAKSETLTSGEFVSNSDLSAQPIPITVEEFLVRDLAVSIGDTLVWDVQGIPIQTYISGIRKVDWQRVEPNFYIIFPAGILENAPQFWVLLTQFTTKEQSNAVKKDLVTKIPNVSVIDLNVILDTVDSILQKIALAIQFMAFFSMLTGVIVLISSILSSRFQRVKESVLLRTLGASKKQIEQILLSEFFFIGFLATATGLVLAVVATWSLTVFVFESTFEPNFVLIFGGFIVTALLTITIGWFNSRGLSDEPPLQVLRNEE